jgi:hypothetical protein
MQTKSRRFFLNQLTGITSAAHFSTVFFPVLAWAPSAQAADPRRDRLVELKTASGEIFLRVTTTYIGKTPDPTFTSLTTANTENADFYSRQFQNLSAAPIEFIRTITYRGDGRTLTDHSTSPPTTAGSIRTEHDEKRPKFGRTGNILASNSVYTQRNLIVVNNLLPTMSLFTRVTARHSGVEYTYEDELIFFAK